MTDTMLGKDVPYPRHYSPELLCPISRSRGRVEKGLDNIAFFGVDVWTAYELSWLDNRGKPQVRIGSIEIPCDSPCLVESKSLKLYLNSLNNQQFPSESEVVNCIEKDIAGCVGGQVQVRLMSIEAFGREGFSTVSGVCLDSLDVAVDCYEPTASYLKTLAGEPVAEALYSHLLKTNCPVTGQPDWATLWVNYRGAPISREGLLQYLISFRNHQDFHEVCVETIYRDILHFCRPEFLQVYARYTRRGGLDINPYRSSEAAGAPPVFRISRQ